ncbi:MAG: hypothetical protein KC656_16660 [Myxococcales bacterium]|nr:hypothetical protein [Myxococcales bacterium]
MTLTLTDDEYQPLVALPIEQIVDLAAELDLVAPERIDRRELVSLCVLALVDHGKANGLPFSKYDADDLQELSQEDLDAIGRLQGLSGRATVPAVLKAGQKVYKTFSARRVDHPIPLMLPMLLSAVARAARAR